MEDSSSSSGARFSLRCRRLLLSMEKTTVASVEDIIAATKRLPNTVAAVACNLGNR